MVPHKKVVDEVSGWLRLHDDGSVDRTWTGPPHLKFLADPVPPHDEFLDGVATRDVDTIFGLRVRLYLPERNSKDRDKLPILLHFHGGGFCISEPDWFMYYHYYTRIAGSARVICISPYLRRAPEHRLPAAIDDGISTLLWLQSVAKGNTAAHEPWLEEHADFGRVFLIGDSTGGTIVHHVAARAAAMDLNPLRLAGGVLVQPGFLRSTRSRSELEKPQSPFLTLDMVDKFLSFALPAGSNKDHPITCPMGAGAPPLEGLKLPPFLVCVAEMDLIVDTEMEYYEAMKKAKKELEMFVSEGVGHGFYLNKIAIDTDPNTSAQTQALIARVKEFIDNH